MFIDKKILYIVLGLFIVSNLAGLLSNTNALLSLLISLPAVLIAITFHEYAHAWAADRLGDDTPRRQGRLSLNPFSHLDPIGTVMLVFAGFGWGKPVEIDSRNFNRNIKMSVAEAIVAAAGPLMNFILAIIFTIIYTAIWKFAPSFVLTQVGSIVMILLSACVSVNVGLGVFNLIPLPPLDGSKIIMPFLPYKAKEWFTNNEQLFSLVFVVLWITGIAGTIISPAINLVTTGILSLGKLIIG